MNPLPIINKQILVDMDGVLANYHAEFKKRWTTLHPETPLMPHDLHKEFRIHENYPLYLHEEMLAISLAPDFFHSLRPIKDSIDGILHLAKNNSVYICTSPQTKNDHCIQGKISFIKQYLSPEWLKRTIITKDKTLIHADYLIDDKSQISGARIPSWEHILYDQPYNRHIKDKKRMTWTEGFF